MRWLFTILLSWLLINPICPCGSVLAGGGGSVHLSDGHGHHHSHARCDHGHDDREQDDVPCDAGNHPGPRTVPGLAVKVPDAQPLDSLLSGLLAYNDLCLGRGLKMTDGFALLWEPPPPGREDGMIPARDVFAEFCVARV